MADKTLKILVAEPMKPCQVREIPNTLDAMREIVGGHIESFSYQRASIISNEEGKLLGLPRNRPLYDSMGMPIDVLRGTFFIVGVSGEHFVSLTEDQLRQFKELYDNMMATPAERQPPQKKSNQKKKGDCHDR